MHRNGGVYENYLACALMLSLVECWFLYSDTDRAVEDSVRRLAAVLHKEDPIILDPPGEVPGLPGPRPESGRLLTAYGGDASVEGLRYSIRQNAGGRTRPAANRMIAVPREDISSKEQGRALQQYPRAETPERANTMRRRQGEPGGALRPAPLASSAIPKAMRDAVAPQVGLHRPAARRTTITAGLTPSSRYLPDRNRSRKNISSNPGRFWRPATYRASSRSIKARGESQWLNSKELPFSKEFRMFKEHRENDKVRHVGKLPHFYQSSASLRQLLGSGALKPPQGRLEPPDFSRFEKRRFGLPDGKEFRLTPVKAREAELLRPPEDIPSREYPSRDRPASAPHWHGQYLHAGRLWALPFEDHWIPLQKEAGHWWTVAEGQHPLIWSQGRWWWKEDNVWFVLHDGQPWAYRWFSEWQRDGLLNPQTNTRIVYSGDELKAAVITPGTDTVLFDLRTGSEIRRWAERPKRIRRYR